VKATQTTNFKFAFGTAPHSILTSKLVTTRSLETKCQQLQVEVRTQWQWSNCPNKIHFGNTFQYSAPLKSRQWIRSSRNSNRSTTPKPVAKASIITNNVLSISTWSKVAYGNRNLILVSLLPVISSAHHNFITSTINRISRLGSSPASYSRGTRFKFLLRQRFWKGIRGFLSASRNSWKISNPAAKTSVHIIFNWLPLSKQNCLSYRQHHK
jgi:hypothetical protein